MPRLYRIGGITETNLNSIILEKLNETAIYKNIKYLIKNKDRMKNSKDSFNNVVHDLEVNTKKLT